MGPTLSGHYILQFRQIYFAPRTNTIKQFGQIHWSTAAPDPWTLPPIGRFPPRLIGHGSDTQSILQQGWTETH